MILAGGRRTRGRSPTLQSAARAWHAARRPGQSKHGETCRLACGAAARDSAFCSVGRQCGRLEPASPVSREPVLVPVQHGRRARSLASRASPRRRRVDAGPLATQLSLAGDSASSRSTCARARRAANRDASGPRRRRRPPPASRALGNLERHSAPGRAVDHRKVEAYVRDRAEPSRSTWSLRRVRLSASSCVWPPTARV